MYSEFENSFRNSLSALSFLLIPSHLKTSLKSISKASGLWRRCSPKDRAKSFCDSSSGRRESTKLVKGVAGCAELGVADTCPAEVLDVGAELVTCVAEEELVADCHRLVSIVPEGSESLEDFPMVLDAALHATVPIGCPYLGCLETSKTF